MARKRTRLVQAGRDPALHAGAVNVPVYRASTILFPDLESMRSEAMPYTYGRRGTPTTRSLEQAVCELEGGARTVLAPSGLAACSLAILTTCGAGDHILVSDWHMRRRASFARSWASVMACWPIILSRALAPG